MRATGALKIPQPFRGTPSPRPDRPGRMRGRFGLPRDAVRYFGGMIESADSFSAPGVGEEEEIS